MKHHRGRHVDIESVAELDGHLAAGAGSLKGWRLRSLDLTSRSAALRETELAGATFLGCTFAPGDVDYAEDEGALVMPVIPEAPVDVYRSKLYTADELYDDPQAGVALVHQLRGQRETARIPIVIHSVYVRHQSDLPEPLPRVEALLPKPFKMNQLRDLVARYCEPDDRGDATAEVVII